MKAAILAATLLAAAGGTPYAAKAQDLPTIRTSLEEDEQMVWDDVDGEVAYRVSGAVLYVVPPTCSRSGYVPGETVNFSEELPADTTSFRLPSPRDSRLTFRKDIYHFRVEALTAGGGVIALGGYDLQVDGICTPEELAAAGTGAGASATMWWLPSILAALGGLVLAGGLALRRAA